MRPVADKYPALGIQTLVFYRVELLEERGDMYDTAAPNEIDTGRIDQTRW